MQRIILHIGVENTATTYLQSTFARSRAALKQNGILYPLSPGDENHLAVAALAINEDTHDSLHAMFKIKTPEDAAHFRFKFRGDLRAEADDSRCEVMLLSSEHCSSRVQSPEEVGRLVDFLRSLAPELTVVGYLRRQDEALLSMYSTSIRDGWIEPLGMPSPDEIAKRFDYWALLDRWEQVVGRDNLIVRKFDSLDGDIVQDFSTAVGFPSSISWSRPEKRLNVRLSAQQAEFLRRMNTFLPPSQNAGRSRGDITKIVESFPTDGQRLRLSHEITTQLFDAVRDSNLAVAQRYFGQVVDGEDPLFGDVMPAGQSIFSLPYEEFVKIAADVWSVKHQQSSHLWDHVQRLQKELREMRTRA